MSAAAVVALTTLTMMAFAANSVLCRLALAHTAMDAGSFTLIRLASGALVLLLLVRQYRRGISGGGSWWSALALLVYAAAFSYAYNSLSAATGALLLFAAVQATMIAVGLVRGERLGRWQWLGVVMALAGLLGLLLPGLSAPPLLGALLMLAAGGAWGVYSLRGRTAGDPLRVTAGNFIRAAVLALPLGLGGVGTPSWDSAGVIYALLSGALASGMGYALWYSVLPSLAAVQAASVQLSVPLLAALGGVLLLSEPLSGRLLLTALAILGGIALVVIKPARA